MIPVNVPTTDVNSETATLVAWRVEDQSFVDRGAALAELETSKAIIDVVAPGAGFVLFEHPTGAEVPLDQPIALLFETQDERTEFVRQRSSRHARTEPAATGGGVRATVKARALAERLGVDIERLDGSRLVTTKMVREAAGSAQRVTLPEPLMSSSAAQRILIIGGGRGATQVIDILEGGDAQRAVAIVDDGREKWGQMVDEVPVVGGSARIGELFDAGKFDAAIIAISTSIAARTKLRRLCESLGVPLANAIDPTSKIARRAQLGTGNVICAFCQIGTSTVVGDNNFLSAYNSFDHHNTLGSDISTGPGVVTSSRVRIADRCRLGTGIFIQPGVELGAGVRVASGATLVANVPADHSVKTKIVTTKVVRNRS